MSLLSPSQLLIFFIGRDVKGHISSSSYNVILDFTIKYKLEAKPVKDSHQTDHAVAFTAKMWTHSHITHHDWLAFQ